MTKSIRVKGVTKLDKLNLGNILAGGSCAENVGGGTIMMCGSLNPSAATQAAIIISVETYLSK